MKCGERNRCKFRIIGAEQTGRNSSSFPWLKYISVFSSGQGTALSYTPGSAMVEQPVVHETSDWRAYPNYRTHD